jgi:cytochrome P450
LIEIMKVKASGKVDQNSKQPKVKASVYASVVDNPSLPPQERTLLRLEQEGALLALAGTESPAQTLNILFYHLLSNPSILATLRAEINSVPLSWSNLDRLPYLSAVIEEANRLSFGVTARAARIAPEPLVYTPTSYTTSPHNGKSYTIPSGTPVSITTLCAHTAETVFPSPCVFDPTRWLGDEGRERRKFQLAFSKGGRKCLGIELASAELCLVTATLVQKFEMKLWETDKDDVAFLHDYHVAMPKMGSKGVRVTAKVL